MLDALTFPITADNRSRPQLNQVLGDLGQIRGALAGVQDYGRRASRAMRRIGTGLTAAVTVPVTGMLYAMDRSIGQMTQLEAQARAAGITAEQLTVLSLASREFGIEQDKVADILRDVNDRLGDFRQTGAGPMADFFENIAPQVGLTIESFENLSSSDALRLYVSALEEANANQSDMTFYMEALASDATLLLPLFQQNGRAIDDMAASAARLGLSIDSDLISSAANVRREWNTVRTVLGVEVQQALIELAPALADVTRGLLDFVEPVRRAVQWFSDLEPQVQRNIVAAGLLGAALGPLSIGIGGLVFAVTGLIGVLGTLAVVVTAHPLIAAATALAGLGLLVWQNWEPISEFFSALWSDVTAWAQDAYDAVAARWAAIPEYFSQLLRRIPAAFSAMWDEVRALFSGWVEDMREVGRQLVDGMIVGLASAQQYLPATMRAMVGAIIGAARDEAGIQSPSRVFREIGGLIMEGLDLGLRDKARDVQGTMRDVMGAILDTGGSGSIGTAIRDMVTGSMSFLDMLTNRLRQVSEDLLELAANQAWDMFAGRAAKGGGGGLLGLFTQGLNWLFNADGNAFSNGKVMPFAAGGVVSAPTMFPMRGGLGMMGEAGPEAIMPLARAPGGRLGVQAVSGNAAPAPVVVQPVVENYHAAAEVRQEVEQGPDGQVIQRLIVTEMARAIGEGRVDGAMRARFGSRPQGRAR